MFDEPTGFELPPKGFDVDDPGFVAPWKMVQVSMLL